MEHSNTTPTKILILETRKFEQWKFRIQRITLLLALLDEHQLRFSKYKTAQELWAAILKKFGGNEATRKMKKNLLKQQYGNFKAEGKETLEQTFNKLQIDEDDIKEMDIKWNMALLSMSAGRLWKKTGKKISIQGTDVAGFDKSKHNEIVKRQNQTLVEAATSSSGLVPNPILQQPCIPPNRDDWDDLFQPMFDEYFNSPTIVVSPVPVVAAPRAVDLADSLVSTSIDQDGPSTSIPSTQEQEHSINISQGFEESPKTPTFRDDPLHESLHEDLTSQRSSSNMRQTYTIFEHLGRWTKDHPITSVIRDPSRCVSTRKQLQTDVVILYDHLLSYHIKMDSIIPLGQKNTLAEYMILSGADNRPPMLDKDLKFVTDVKLVKDLHTTNFDQLHAYLEQHKLHANEPQFNHSSVLPSYPYQSQMNYKTSSVPQIAYQSPQVSTQPMTESPLVNSGLAVPVFSLGDDQIACLNKAMAFLTTVASSRFPSTNNQIRTSSNPRNKATIQDGRVTVKQVQRRQGQSYFGTGYKSNATSSEGNNASEQTRVVKCYNCQDEGHMARQCTQPKRPRNATWYKDKTMLAEAQKARQILDEEQLAFLADPGVPDGQVV
nr:hypothetical protein [Tanacetum cinerariifolium]